MCKYGGEGEKEKQQQKYQSNSKGEKVTLKLHNP
jgi:hypothetical protein